MATNYGLEQILAAWPPERGEARLRVLVALETITAVKGVRSCSVSLLAKVSGLDYSTVRYTVRVLETDGLLTWTPGSGRGNFTRWRMTLPPAKGASPTADTFTDPKGASSRPAKGASSRRLKVLVTSQRSTANANTALNPSALKEERDKTSPLPPVAVAGAAASNGHGGGEDFSSFQDHETKVLVPKVPALTDAQRRALLERIAAKMPGINFPDRFLASRIKSGTLPGLLDQLYRCDCGPMRADHWIAGCAAADERKRMFPDSVAPPADEAGWPLSPADRAVAGALRLQSPAGKRAAQAIEAGDRVQARMDGEAEPDGYWTD